MKSSTTNLLNNSLSLSLYRDHRAPLVQTVPVVTQVPKDHQVPLELLVPLVEVETLGLPVLTEVKVLVDCLAILELQVMMDLQDHQVKRYYCSVYVTSLCFELIVLFRDFKDMLVMLVMLDQQDKL